MAWPSNVLDSDDKSIPIGNAGLVILRLDSAIFKGAFIKDSHFTVSPPSFPKTQNLVLLLEKHSNISSIKSYFLAFGWSTVNRILPESSEMCQAARCRCESGMDHHDDYGYDWSPKG